MNYIWKFVQNGTKFQLSYKLYVSILYCLILILIADNGCLWRCQSHMLPAEKKSMNLKIVSTYTNNTFWKFYCWHFAELAHGLKVCKFFFISYYDIFKHLNLQKNLFFYWQYLYLTKYVTCQIAIPLGARRWWIKFNFPTISSERFESVNNLYRVQDIIISDNICSKNIIKPILFLVIQVS